MLIFQTIQLEPLCPEETSDTGHLFEANADVFTLAGLDDDWESIEVQPKFTQRREHSFLDDDGPGLDCVTLNLDAPSIGFSWHTSTRSDVSRFCDLGAAALDQPVLDLDSDDEMGEEAVLDF